MSAAAALIDELNRSGIRLEARGDKLHVTPPPGMDTSALRQRLAERKTEIMAALKDKHDELLRRCNTACRGLPVSPAALLAERRENFSECPSGELTKPTKPPFGSIVSTQNGPFQNKQARKPDLFARCRDACRGLPVSPGALLASLAEEDKTAIRSGDPDELKALRTFAECLAEREKPKLDAAIAKAYRWCQAELARRPEITRAAYTVDPDADPALLALAVRGVGSVTLKIEKATYQGRVFELIELLHRAGVAKFDATKEDTR